MLVRQYGRGGLMNPTLSQALLARGVIALLAKHGPSLLSGGKTLLSSLFGTGKGKKKGKRGVLSNTDRLKGSQSMAPVAINNSVSNPTYWHEESLPLDVGIAPGIRIIGRQYLTAGNITITLGDLFSGGAASSPNVIYLSPDAFGGRVALIARTYMRYAFRHVRVYFITGSTTAQPGAMALSYVADGAATAFATYSFANSFQNDPCTISSARENAVMEMNYMGQTTWDTELDTATAASVRETVQGDILGYWDGSAAVTAAIGYFLVEYCLDMYQPCADFGFTVSTRDPEFKKYIQAYDATSSSSTVMVDQEEYIERKSARGQPVRR